MSRNVAVPAAMTLLVGIGVVAVQLGGGTDLPGQSPHHHPTDALMVSADRPAPVVVDRSGWTVTASSQETTLAANQAVRAIDGDAGTFWRTTDAASAGPQPDTLTIDMKAEVPVAGITYLPRKGSKGDGNIGAYQVQLSADGATWGEPVATGTFADDAEVKATEFSVTPARFVRITAVNEADGGTGPVSAAEVNVLAVAAADPDLPRTGWTATADSAQSGYPAGNVLDGNHSSYWHTVWGDTGPTHPHNVTIDMKANKSVTGVSYLPRQDASNNGTVGNYRIEVSTTGTSWTSVATGTFADTKALKAVAFTAVTARYLRFVALTEAGNRGRWSSAAEIHPQGPSGTTPTPTPTASPTPSTPTPTASKGRWSGTIGFPIVPGSAAVLPNGKLLTWSANNAMSFGGNGRTYTAMYTPSSNAVAQRIVTNTGHDMFCPGISYTADGRVLVTGGDDAGKSSYYNASNDTWSTGPVMAIPRAYQSTTTLSDGRVFALGGSWRGGVGGKNGEIWNGTSWSRLTGAPVAPALTADAKGEYRADNHMWLFGWSNGRVLQAGPSKTMNWYHTGGSGSTSRIGTRAADGDSMGGNAVMYDTGKILTVGGSPSYENSDATANAHVVTISGTSTVAARKVTSMRYARAYHNSVVLPDGKVFVVGGLPYPKPFSDANAPLTPELWDPATETFTTMAPMAVPRTYHSVAVLLPDGRVFVGGGGMCGTCTTNHPNGEIFTPPNLVNADGTLKSRPSITSAPSTAAPGTSITVATSRAVSRFALVRLGTATHTVNTDQRRLSLTSTTTTGGYSVAIPADRGVVLPGPYMLFALDSSGVPSVARMITVR